jgi:hypothetical protein
MGRRRRRGLPCGRPVLVDLSSELVQVRVECRQQSSQRVPADVEPSGLGVGDVSLAGADPRGEFLLRDPCLLAQCSKRAAEDEPICARVCHVPVVSLGEQVRRWDLSSLTCSARVLGTEHSGARAGTTAGRRGSESSSLPVRRPRYQRWIVVSSHRAVLPAPPIKEDRA